MEVQVLSQNPEARSLIARSGAVVATLVDDQGKTFCRFSNLKAAKWGLQEMRAGKVDGVTLTADEAARLDADIVRTGLEPDIVALYDKIVALSPDDVADLRGFAVSRCGCTRSFEAHANIFFQGLPLIQFGFLEAAVIEVDAGVRSGKLPQDLAITLLRRIRATGIPADHDEFMDRYNAAPEEERRAAEEEAGRKVSEPPKTAATGLKRLMNKIFGRG